MPTGERILIQPGLKGIGPERTPSIPEVETGTPIGELIMDILTHGNISRLSYVKRNLRAKGTNRQEVVWKEISGVKSQDLRTLADESHRVVRDWDNPVFQRLEVASQAETDSGDRLHIPMMRFNKPMRESTWELFSQMYPGYMIRSTRPRSEVYFVGARLLNPNSATEARPSELDSFLTACLIDHEEGGGANVDFIRSFAELGYGSVPLVDHETEGHEDLRVVKAIGF